MLSRSRILLALAVVLAAIVVAAALRLPRVGAKANPEAESASDAALDILSALSGASGWLNGDIHTLDSLRGHPIVLALWSDTDPRSFDALPRVQSWHEAYRRYGVRVIGVYAPEFIFGVDSTVPARMCKRLGLTFPIVLDPSYRVRSSMGSVGGGGIALTDTKGRVVLTTDLEQLDRVDHVIREGLRRSHPGLGIPVEVEETAHASPRAIRSVPLGTGRVESGPLSTAVPGRANVFTAQFRFQEEGKEYVPYPVGRWIPTAEGLVADRGGASDFVAIRNPGDRLEAVLSPSASGVSRLWILADGGWLSAGERGADVRIDPRGASYVDVTEPRLYEIVRPGRSHVLRFSPEEPGLTIHAFTFEKVSKESDAERPRS